MRLINPTIFRKGAIAGWDSSNYLNLKQSLVLTEKDIQAILQSYLGNIFNLFVIKTGLRHDTGTNTLEITGVFYKYIQRARLVKSRRMALLIATGAFKTKPPLVYLRRAQGFAIPIAVIVQLETMLSEALGKTVRLNLYNIFQINTPSLGHFDNKVRADLEGFMRGRDKQLAKSDGKRAWPPFESRLERNWINLLAIRGGFFRYKAFRNVVYSLDGLAVTLYCSRYDLSNLRADLIIRGLQRNVKNHKQFLNLIETTIEHLRSYSNWPFKPTDWRIAIHGKIGSGTIRSRSYYITTGYLPLQTISVPLNYSYRSAETKFGSIGVKVWMAKTA